MQRALAPFKKNRTSRDSHIGPYYSVEKGESATRNMTGETLVTTKNAMVPKPLPAVPEKHPTNLTVDTNYQGPRSVSPVSPDSREPAPDVSPVSPEPSYAFPPRQPPLIANPARATAISVAGSEARIVSIPARSSGGSAGPGWRPPVNNNNAPRKAGDRGPGGGRHRPPPRAPPRDLHGPTELRPPPLSMNRTNHAPPVASHAPVAELNGGYKAYNPAVRSAPPPATVVDSAENRASRGSLGALSTASSGVLCPEAWPMPPSTSSVPSTPRTSPDYY